MPRMGKGPLVSPVMCSRTSLLASPVEGRRWCSGSPARLQATKDGSTGWGPPVSQHRNGCGRTWRAPASELPGTPGPLGQPRTGSSQQAARTCAPPQLASETHTETWHQASLLEVRLAGKSVLEDTAVERHRLLSQRLLSAARPALPRSGNTFLFTDCDLNSHGAPPLEKQTGFTEPIPSEQVCLRGPVSTQNKSGQMHVELRAPQPAAPPRPGTCILPTV